MACQRAGTVGLTVLRRVGEGEGGPVDWADGIVAPADHGGVDEWVDDGDVDGGGGNRGREQGGKAETGTGESGC